MEISNFEKTYINFLEVINKAQDVETLCIETFKIIQKIFNTSRVQIWEEVLDTNEMSVLFECFTSNDISMLKLRMPYLPEESLRKINQSDVWEYTNISDKYLIRYKINSLLGLELKINTTAKNFLILTFTEKTKKLSKNEILFLIELKNLLEQSIIKNKNYEKALEELKRLQSQSINLREQDHRRTNLINNISHEFRTPLLSILGYSKMLLTKNPSQITTKEIIEQISQAANRLSSLITDFLQINKSDYEGWSVSLEPTDIGELIKTSVKEFSNLNKKHEITYHISSNCLILKTDTKLVRVVLDNLISNAIKYSPDGGKVKVSLIFPPEKQNLEISVTDEGIGIQKEEINKIFDRFYRASDPKIQNISGSGLGLAICKEILSILNGSIKAESVVNKGSAFTFTLPIT
ncbi:MAG: hypothetical protein HYY52_05445 [Candidatus Melainabacteria bacterium]|nr:hypothetical protein [Candidatus Melainabacteria bacterium]